MGIQIQKNMTFIILYTLHDDFCSEYGEKLRSSGETLSPGVSMLVPRRFGREACFRETPSRPQVPTLSETDIDGSRLRRTHTYQTPTVVGKHL